MRIQPVIRCVAALVALGCNAQPAAERPTQVQPAQVTAPAPAEAQATATAQVAPASLVPAEPGVASACGAAASGDVAHASCGACASGESSCGAEPRPGAEQAGALANGLNRVSASAGLCMLSNRYLGERPDVPIDVAGKTYHGCCAGCAARLASQAAARQAVDPVSGRTVDKASAIIARDAQNRLYYFENEASLARYRAL